MVLPYYLVFELIGPVVELVGLVAIAAGFAFGLVDAGFALLFAGVAFAYGVFLGVASLAAEEFSFRRYTRWRDLGAALAACVIENIGYRQLHAWWRLQGLVAAIRRRDAAWGVMPRTGFTSETVEAPAEAA